MVERSRGRFERYKREIEAIPEGERKRALKLWLAALETTIEVEEDSIEPTEDERVMISQLEQELKTVLTSKSHNN
jgi:hypothetical protein